VSERHVILGGSGFIGRHVGLLLARAGHRVTLAARHRPAYAFPLDVADNITWTVLELGSADWDRVVEDANVVHHYAWGSIPASANSNPGGDLITNVSSTIDLLEALRRRGGARIVFSSSGGTVYGKIREIPVGEDHPLAPITAYGASKATAEIYLGLYHAMYGMDCRIARIANPYGAGQDFTRGLGAVTTFLRKAIAGEPIQIWGTGEVVRDFIHIADVANCLVTLAQAPLPEKTFIFNIGSGSGVSLNDIVAEVEVQLDRQIEVTRTQNRAFDVPINVLAIDRAKQVLGWVPKISLSNGIARTIVDLVTNPDFSSLDVDDRKSAHRVI
jgi:UDP-glucose 4-epimerase